MRLPKDVHDRIAFYLPFSNTAYQTDESLRKRILKSEGMVKQAQISPTQLIAIQADNLVVVWPESFIIQQTLIDTDDAERVINKFSYGHKIGMKLNIIEGFVLSSTYNYLLVKIQHYVLRKNQKNNDIYCPTHKMQWFKFDAEKKTYINENCLIFPYSTVKLMAISNFGEIAIKNGIGEIEVYDTNGIKQLTKKPQYLENGKDEIALRGMPVDSLAGMVIQQCFNGQGTKIAIQLHYLYEYFKDNDQSDTVFNDLTKEWFLRNYPEYYQKIAKLFDQNYSSESLLNKLSYSDGIELPPLIRFIQGFDDTCPIEIILLREDEPWTLAKYFRSKLVCHKFNEQCGFTNLSES